MPIITKLNINTNILYKILSNKGMSSMRYKFISLNSDEGIRYKIHTNLLGGKSLRKVVFKQLIILMIFEVAYNIK